MERAEGACDPWSHAATPRFAPRLVIIGWAHVPVAWLVGERAQTLLHQFSLGDVDECDHHAVDLIVHRAVRVHTSRLIRPQKGT
jgi:hypothetical protein